MVDLANAYHVDNDTCFFEIIKHTTVSRPFIVNGCRGSAIRDVEQSLGVSMGLFNSLRS
jgi:hypothetical protein